MAVSSAQGVPAWADLESTLEQKASQVGETVSSLSSTEFETRGDLNPAATRDESIRLFDASGEDDVVVTFYRDPAYWCPYCERLQLQLELKRIPYRIRTINMRCYGSKPAYYTARVPSGLLPALELGDGRIWTESFDIMMMLEEKFPNSALSLLDEKLVPGGKNNRQFKNLLKLEREAYGWWCTYIFRPDSGRGKRGFENVLDNWNAALLKIAPGTSFMFGEHPTLIDVLAAPFFERYVASLMAYKGHRVRGEERYSAIHAWMSALENEVQAFRAIKADFYSTIWDLPPQVGDPSISPAGEKATATICGRDGAWGLPLEPVSADVAIEPVTHLAADDGGLGEYHHLQAAAKVVGNSQRVVGFALRGTGSRPRTVWAPLSDPDAVPNEAIRSEVDLAIRGVLSGILKEQNGSTTPTLSTEVAGLPADTKRDIASSLSYFADRIGVPRDLPYPAARILRAHLSHHARLLTSD